MSKRKPKKMYTGRDLNMVKIINGATKSGTHKDQKKESNKYSSREKLKINKCKQCGSTIYPSDIVEDLYDEDFLQICHNCLI